MAEQIKPDIPTLIKRITEIASLPPAEKEKVHKFNRTQLTELFIYLQELKKSRQELLAKINSIDGSDNEG